MQPCFIYSAFCMKTAACASCACSAGHVSASLRSSGPKLGLSPALVWVRNLTMSCCSHDRKSIGVTSTCNGVAAELVMTSMPCRLDTGKPGEKPSLFKRAQLKRGYAPSEDFQTKQVFATSKDGTKVPMFVTHRKGLRLDGSAPTLLYGYGGGDSA